MDCLSSLLFKEECGYSVIFPDLNHLATCGETLDEAMKMAVDCLAGHIRWCRRDGDITLIFHQWSKSIRKQ